MVGTLIDYLVHTHTGRLESWKFLPLNAASIGNFDFELLRGFTKILDFRMQRGRSGEVKS
jgi:hypothetical protein